MAKNKQERKMVKVEIYLYRKCARAKQEGVMRLTNPHNNNEELHFDCLDEIPRKIRKHLEMIGLTYDVADDSDMTVIETKSKKSRVIQKIRLKDVGQPESQTTP